MDTVLFTLHFEGSDIIMNAFVANKEKEILLKKMKVKQTRTVLNIE